MAAKHGDTGGATAKDSLEDALDRNWDKRKDSLEQVKWKLRNGWRNDEFVLNQYFQAVVANWKLYTGPRTPEQILKVQSIYKQAIYGDNTEAPPANIKSADGVKWKAWYGFKGMSMTMAKRRFITYLSEIDPLLIDVMPEEKPPLGFPLDRHGRHICAKCNTVVGNDIMYCIIKSPMTVHTHYIILLHHIT